MRYRTDLPRPRLVDRESFLVSCCQGRRVLHVGCVDSGLLSDRLSSNTLLHGKLAGVASELWGLDLDEEGIAHLRDRGYWNLHVGSGEAIPDTIPREYFDVVLAGELIEHLLNPGLFLKEAASRCAASGRVILTTPNGLRLTNLVGPVANSEMVHPEHTLSFTPATLRRLLSACGLSTGEILVYQGRNSVRIDHGVSLWDKGIRLAYNALGSTLVPAVVRVFPYFSDGLILVAHPGPLPQDTLPS